MTKMEMINDVISGLVMTLTKDQLEVVKATFIVKMQGYDIHEVCTLPSVEVRDNDFIFQRFVVDHLAKGLKKSTIRSYMDHIKPFFAFTGMNYRDVTAQTVTDYIAYKTVTPNIKGKKNSQNHICNISKVLHIFFQWAYRKHHIDTDIMLDVDRVKPKQKKKDRLTAEEIEACREVAKNTKDRALFELMMSTGMRVGEIAALRIDDIDFAKKTVHIPEGKTDSAERDVYLTIKAKNALIRYLGERNSGYVFRPLRQVLEDDKPIGNGTIEKWVKDIGERAKCHCITTVHVFRKTFASEEYRRTGNVKYVSILLGHSSTAVTEKFYLVDDLQSVAYMALSAA